jgi:hypothetical protein
MTVFGGKPMPAPTGPERPIITLKNRTPRPAPKQSNSGGLLVHWPIVALAGVPCLLFVLGVIALLAAVPGPKPSRAAVPSIGAAPVETTPATKVEPATEARAELQIPAHHPVQLPLNDLPVFEPVDRDAAPAAEAPAKEAVAILDPKPEKEACQKFGTSVNFVATPTEAYQAAQKEKKLTFLLHVSGNFEDSGFT